MSDFEEMRRRWREQGLEPSESSTEPPSPSSETDAATSEPASDPSKAAPNYRGPRVNIPLYEQNDKADIERERAEEAKHAYVDYESQVEDGTYSPYVVGNTTVDAKDWSRGTWVVLLGTLTIAALIYVAGVVVLGGRTASLVGLGGLPASFLIMYFLWNTVDRHTRDLLRMLVPAYPLVAVGALVGAAMFSSNKRNFELEQEKREAAEKAKLAPQPEPAEHRAWRERVLPGLEPMAARYSFEHRLLQRTLPEELDGPAGASLVMGLLQARERCSAALLSEPTTLEKSDAARLESCVQNTVELAPRVRSWADEKGVNLALALEQGAHYAPVRGFMGPGELNRLLNHAWSAPAEQWPLHLSAIQEAARAHPKRVAEALAVNPKPGQAARRLWVQARAQLDGPSADPCAELATLRDADNQTARAATKDLRPVCEPEYAGPEPWWRR